jgi:uncharacterized DUF497 family protein
MPRPIREFRISKSAEMHIFEKHGLELEEIIEAADSSRAYMPAGAEPSDSLNATGHRRYMVAGKTECGRRVWVIFADEGDGIGRIITAREATGKQECQRHRRVRGN